MSTPEPTIDATGLDSTPAPAAPAVYGRPPVLRTLIRRELWEHRALWIAPLSVAALLLVGATIGRVNFDSNMAALPEQRSAVFGLVVALAALPQFFTLGLIVSMYAADCLYTERKDRSILFWKSMPVSDTLTVLSKLLLAMVLVPFGVYLVSAATTLLMSGIYYVRAWDHAGVGGVFWDAGAWLRIQGISLLAVIAGVLWYAPITAYLLLLSAWARRSVWLWVILPPLVIAMMERIALGTHHVWNILVYRLGAVFVHTGMSMPGAPGGAGQPLTLNMLIANINPLPVFANVDLWLGVLVAALLIVATIRIRQYRDDT
jgi:ABC-2 type transport system permease protein